MTSKQLSTERRQTSNRPRNNGTSILPTFVDGWRGMIRNQSERNESVKEGNPAVG